MFSALFNKSALFFLISHSSGHRNPRKNSFICIYVPAIGRAHAQHKIKHFEQCVSLMFSVISPPSPAPPSFVLSLPTYPFMSFLPSSPPSLLLFLSHPRFFLHRPFLSSPVPPPFRPCLEIPEMIIHFTFLCPGNRPQRNPDRVDSFFKLRL